MKEKNTNEIEVIAEEIVSKKTQKVSISYTLKSFGENIKKLEDNELINKEEAERLKEIQKNAMFTWMKKEFNM